jgi:hypothetical protein
MRASDGQGIDVGIVARMVLAAAPEVFNDNVMLISVIVLGAIALFVIRAVQRFALRLALIALLVGVAGFIYVERDDLEQCGRTCTCDVGGLEFDLPACEPDLLPG